MGFNNKGMRRVAGNLNKKKKGIVCINIGANANSINKILDYSKVLNIKMLGVGLQTVLVCLMMELQMKNIGEYLILIATKLKKRVVIGGSHGKTSITAMILHVLKNIGMDFDYLVGAQIPILAP